MTDVKVVIVGLSFICVLFGHLTFRLEYLREIWKHKEKNEAPEI